MSMIRCEGCDRLVDSDDDPDCFCWVENKALMLCEACRDDAYAEPYWTRKNDWVNER